MGRDLEGVRLRALRRLKWSAVAVGLLALSMAAPAHGAKAGGGFVDGTLKFTPGIAPLGPVCSVSSIEAPGGLSAHAFALDTQIVGYVGPATIEVFGQTGCETLSGGNGTLSARITGYNQHNGARIDCPQSPGDYLVGGYIRSFTQMRVRLAGPCTINEFGTSNVSFVGELEFEPRGVEQGAGRTAPVTSAQVRGPFAVTPG